jgi:hypothetical protein
MVYESMVLMYLFGPKREVTGDCRKLHVEELMNLHSLPDIMMVI